MSLADKPINPCEIEYSVASAIGSSAEVKSYKENGMTLREYYAGLAMQGILANDFNNGIDYSQYVYHSECAVKYSDSLIAQLEKER